MEYTHGMVAITTSKHEVTLTGANDIFHASLSTTQPVEGIDLVQLRIVAQQPASPPVFTLFWTHPIVAIHALWHPGANRNKSLLPAWARGFVSKATSQAPVGCLYSLAGRNRLTFAFSDALHLLEIKAGVHEETAMLHCSITLFTEPSPPLTLYEATIRLDTQDIPYYESLEQVQQWWASMPGYQPAIIPETARLPMYSTWYSFHQHVAASEVEEQCGLANALGCQAVIVDDGWQTESNARGYAYCGDWEVTHKKIPDMKAHVARVHDLGMKYILWYSVPFVGKYSKAWSRFSDRLLGTIERLGAGILDPRFPEVREYIIDIYENALRNWDLDGFKLDFVDSFTLSDEKKDECIKGQDLCWLSGTSVLKNGNVCHTIESRQTSARCVYR
jgi:alpha-galactosidase